MGQLPEFAVRVHAGTRRIRLRVTPREGLIVTLPPDTPASAALDAVCRNRQWVERALARTASRRALHRAGPEGLLPTAVCLRLTGEELPVAYRETESGRCVARDTDGAVVVTGSVRNAEACLGALLRWRDRKAASVLPALLGEVAGEAAVVVPRLTLRTQRTRWGSCSSRGTVSLNRNLVFFPAALARHVVAHEIAHLRHPNHSSRFWEYFEALDPGARQRRRRLKDAWSLVPPWAEP
ncbi:MAG: M48 family metallopeptidase [Coriobacteriia bacterium]|nr:M48 family metallopeptidase [Coriobacteriia bacterium]